MLGSASFFAQNRVASVAIGYEQFQAVTRITNRSAQHGRNMAVLFPFSKRRRARVSARPHLFTSGCTQNIRSIRLKTVPSLNPKLVEVGWFQTLSLPSGRCSCAAPSSFSFCCYYRCRAQQAPPRFLFMARSTRSTTERALSRPPHPNMALSRAAGGAATTIRKLTSAKNRQVRGYPLQKKVGEPPTLRRRRRRGTCRTRWELSLGPAFSLNHCAGLRGPPASPIAWALRRPLP